MSESTPEQTDNVTSGVDTDEQQLQAANDSIAPANDNNADDNGQ